MFEFPPPLHRKKKNEEISSSVHFVLSLDIYISVLGQIGRYFLKKNITQEKSYHLFFAFSVNSTIFGHLFSILLHFSVHTIYCFHLWFSVFFLKLKSVSHLQFWFQQIDFYVRFFSFFQLIQITILITKTKFYPKKQCDQFNSKCIK